MSRKLNDLTDQRFGRLTAVMYCRVEKKWLVLCDCGNLKLIRPNKLYSKDGVRSCGCARHDSHPGRTDPRITERRYHIVPGQTFGKWTAKAYERHPDTKHFRWLCQCECGKQQWLPARALALGQTKSCGGRGCKPRTAVSIIGEVFGDWRVLTKVRNSTSYKVQCVLCGRQLTHFTKSQLRSNPTCSHKHGKSLSTEVVTARQQEFKEQPCVCGNPIPAYKTTKGVTTKNRSVYCSRKCFGNDPNRDIFTPGFHLHPRPNVTAFGEAKTLSEWYRDDRCVVTNYNALLKRINLNWEPEIAITTPIRKQTNNKTNIVITPKAVAHGNRLIETFWAIGRTSP